MPNRLWVDELRSIGVVRAGDNEEAKVLIYKSRHQPPAPPKADQLRAVRKASERFDKQLEIVRDGIEELKSIPLSHEPGVSTMTLEDINKQRDDWVVKHRRSGEPDSRARVRFWAENPEAKHASRTAEAGDSSTVVKTVGEKVTEAIDRRARAWHIEGSHFDKSLPTLRTMIRKANPALAELERSTDAIEVAKSRISKTDVDHRRALEFLADWG